MMGLSTIFLIVTYYIQAIHGYFPMLSEEYRLNFAVVRKDVERVVADQTHNFIYATESHKNLVNTALDSLQDEVRQFKQYVLESQKEAADKKKNISHCINSLQLSQLRLKSTLEPCMRHTNLEYLKSEVNFLSDKYNRFDELVEECIKTDSSNPFGTSSIDGSYPCINNLLDVLRSKVFMVDQLDNLFYDSAFKECLSCVQARSKELSQKITTNARNFKECVTAILEPAYKDNQKLYGNFYN